MDYYSGNVTQRKLKMNNMEANKPEYSKKDMWWAVSKTAVATFILAGIFFRFIAVEDTQKEVLAGQVELKKLIEAKNVYTNDRVDKKTDRIQQDVDRNFKEIEKLKIHNTDTEIK